MLTIEHNDTNITTVRLKYKDEFEKWILLTADRHWDNPMSDQDMQLKHLKEAKKRDAHIIDIGDLFCCMQGKYDKRANKSSLRSEHQVDDYFDALVRTSIDYFSPYAKQFILIGMGNHETKVLNRNEINLTQRLIDGLNKKNGTDIKNGWYSGWVNFKFENKYDSTSKKLWYIHGYGGGGPVTKGVIQSNRKAVYLPDADIVATGHVHERWELELSRLRLSDDSKYSEDSQIHIQLPTYKNEYLKGSIGFHVETGKPPKPIGAIWLRFYKEKNEPINFEFKRAK